MNEFAFDRVMIFMTNLQASSVEGTNFEHTATVSARVILRDLRASNTACVFEGSTLTSSRFWLRTRQRPFQYFIGVG
jgi:hypothetical protein